MYFPSPRLWLLLAVGVLIALGGAVVPGLEAIVLPYNLGLLVLFTVTGHLGKKQTPVAIERETDQVLSVRTTNTVKLHIENLTGAPFRFKMRDEPPRNCDAQGHETTIALKPFGKAAYSYTVVPKTRGLWDFDGTYIRFAAPLGLATVVRRLENGSGARVFPNVKAVQEYDLLNQRGHLSLMGVRRSRVKGLGQEFESLREYNDDDFRSIDWKASARRGKLVVKNFEQETNQAVIVCVDLGRHMLGEVDGVRKLDHCLDAALMLMHAAERAGDQIGLLTFNDRVVRYVAPKRGKAQVAAILESIYDAQAEPVQPRYSSAFSYLAARWKKRSLVVVFTDAENPDQARDMSAALSKLRHRHLLYIVRVSDPRLRELTSVPIVNERSLYDRAAAHWYTGERRQAEIVLKAAGLHSLESEPETLSADLVAAYLFVKETAKI